MKPPTLDEIPDAIDRMDGIARKEIEISLEDGSQMIVDAITWDVVTINEPPPSNKQWRYPGLARAWKNGVMVAEGHIVHPYPQSRAIIDGGRLGKSRFPSCGPVPLPRMTASRAIESSGPPSVKPEDWKVMCPGREHRSDLCDMCGAYPYIPCYLPSSTAP